MRKRNRREQTALLQGDTCDLSYATLDALMDRVAASLQRDGLQSREMPSRSARRPAPLYAVVFLGALRAGVAVAPLAPSVTPESDRTRCSAMRNRAGTCSSTPRRSTRWALPAPHVQLHRPRRGRAWHALRTRGLMPEGARPDTQVEAADPSGRSTSSIPRAPPATAERHRAITRHALDPRDARREVSATAPTRRDAAGHAVVFEHHAGGVLPDAGLRRLRGFDGQVRRRRQYLALAERPPHERTRCWCRCSTSA